MFLTSSLQFDPAPRAGEPLVSRRVPDVRITSLLINSLLVVALTFFFFLRMIVFPLNQRYSTSLFQLPYFSFIILFSIYSSISLFSSLFFLPPPSSLSLLFHSTRIFHYGFLNISPSISSSLTINFLFFMNLIHL